MAPVMLVAGRSAASGNVVALRRFRRICCVCGSLRILGTDRSEVTEDRVRGSRLAKPQYF